MGGHAKNSTPLANEGPVPPKTDSDHTRLPILTLIIALKRFAQDIGQPKAVLHDFGVTVGDGR